MTTYADAYRQARQYKNAGLSPAELAALALRYDDEGKHPAAAAFQAVADE
ncbi:hypothetical protein ACGFNP_25030 [Nonomuraea sp. NPDC049269]